MRHPLLNALAGTGWWVQRAASVDACCRFVTVQAKSEPAKQT